MPKKNTIKKLPKAKTGAYLLQVDPKKLTYEDLPCIGCKDKLMAEYGMYMDPGPRMPNLGQSIQNYYQGDSPVQMNPSTRMQNLLPVGTPPDTSKVKPGKPLDPKMLGAQKPKGQGYNAGNVALGLMTAFDALLPNKVSKQQVVQPQMAYNPMPYGYGSQAIMQDGGSVPMPKTKLKPEQEKQYELWRSKLPKNLQYEGDYNLRQLWLDNPGIKPSSNMHFPDKYKMPNHPTFSNESMYFTPLNQHMGGQWQETDSSMNYTPYNSQYKQPLVERKADQGYYIGEDENNSPSAKNGKTMKSKKKLKKYDDGGLAPALFGFMDVLSNEIGGAADSLMGVLGGGGLPLPIGKDGHWIQKAVNPAHKGYCTPMTKSTCTPKRKALAKTFKKMAKNRKKDEGGFIQPGWDLYDYGGIIPDPMSNFRPHQYDQGGNVNGGAKVNMVDGKFPNTDLMEQWLLYNNGGNVNGGAKIKEVGATYPNSDLMEQWLLYAHGGNVNGGADIREVGAKYPNTDLMEQWLLYKDGGNLKAAQGTEIGKDPSKPIMPKPGRPTSSDSLALYNNALKVLDFYRKKGYSEEQKSGIPSDPTAVLDKYAAEYDPTMPRTVPLTTGKAKDIPLSKSQYRKDLNPNQFLQREGADHILDTRAPMQMYDRRIQPTKSYRFENRDTNDPLFGDIVTMYGYDPETIKPASLRGSKISNFSGSAKAPVSTPLPTGPQLNPTDIQGIIPTGVPNVQARPYSPLDLDAAQKTQFSATYKDPSQPSGQKSIYFPNRDAWKGFLGTGALSGYDTSETATGAHATGYRTMEGGGIIYDDGGSIDTMWGGNAELESYNPYDGGTVEFNGNSHAQGGIGMAYNGNPVEVEGGELASKDGDGNLTIYGNMFVPGTKTKFKKAAKAIADKEKSYDKIANLGAELVNEANPASKFEQLKFNAGKVMMQGGQMGMEDLATKKEKLASLQRSMLDMAEQHGLDPHAMSQGKMKKAKKGASIPFYQDGGDPGGNDPTRADRNNSPGNIKWGSWMEKNKSKYGKLGKDKDGFVIFPDKETGLRAMRDLLKSDIYSNKSVKDAIHKWTDKQPYRYDLGAIADKKVSSLSPEEFEKTIATMRQGEGTRYGVAPRPVPKPTPNTPTPRVPVPSTFTPYDLPDIPLTPQPDPKTPGKVNVPYDTLQVPERKPLPSNVEGLKMNQILPELYGIATNKVEPVPTQRYEPQLYTPYQVSFQDRINQNQSAFNAQMRAVGAGNPAAIGTLAAQKYQADQAVLGDEFRTNQSIANDITNKNIALVNDANLKNLGLADTQMVRQSQARSNTRALNQTILNSLSSKYAQNELENKRLAAYENLYDYRFVPQQDGGLSATYFGPNAMFNYSGRNAASQKPQDVRTISRYDASGNLKGYAEYDESEIKTAQRLIDIMEKQRTMPLLQAPPLNK